MVNSDNDSSSLSTKKLSFEQIRDVNDQLRKQLTGRSVLVPFGKKAFFPGSLTPTTTIGGEEEVVVVLNNNRDGVTQQEMTRSRAFQSLQKELDEQWKTGMRKEKPTTADSTASSSDTTPSHAPTQRQVSGKDSNSKSAPAITPPYFEIREELDDSGKEVRAETIDVSRQLEYLRHPGATPPVGATTTTRPSQQAVEEIPVADDTPKVLSNQEYDALSARLEELAMLEQVSENEKAANLASSKKLRSGGWSKGFFNKKPKKAPEKAPPTRVVEAKLSTKQAAKNAGQPVSSNRVTPTQQQEGKPIETSVFSGVVHERGNRSASAKKQSSSKGGKVSFVDEHQVKEIPRIGQTSLSSTKSTTTTTTSRQPMAPPGLAVAEARTAAAASQQRQQPPKKKLSRFAMERRGLL